MSSFSRSSGSAGSFLLAALSYSEAVWCVRMPCQHSPAHAPELLEQQEIQDCPQDTISLVLLPRASRAASPESEGDHSEAYVHREGNYFELFCKQFVISEYIAYCVIFF